MSIKSVSLRRAKTELFVKKFEPRHDKTNKVTVHPAKTQISLGIHPVWSESSLSAWRKLGSLATHWAHSEDCDQTGRMPRLIWVFAGRTLILLVLLCRGSFTDVLIAYSLSIIFSDKWNESSNAYIGVLANKHFFLNLFSTFNTSPNLEFQIILL